MPVRPTGKFFKNDKSGKNLCHVSRLSALHFPFLTVIKFNFFPSRCDMSTCLISYFWNSAVWFQATWSASSVEF